MPLAVEDLDHDRERAGVRRARPASTPLLTSRGDRYDFLSLKGIEEDATRKQA